MIPNAGSASMARIFCSGFFSDIVTCLLRVLLDRTDQNPVVVKATGIKIPVHLQLPLHQIRENQLFTVQPAERLVQKTASRLKLHARLMNQRRKIRIRFFQRVSQFV